MWPRVMENETRKKIYNEKAEVETLTLTARKEGWGGGMFLVKVHRTISPYLSPF